jgi:CheY-like chemotaxis protein
MMNGMSGLDLLARVREHPSFGHLPFILLSGVSAHQIQEEAERLGVSGIFSKPVQESAFLEHIKQFLPTKGDTT